LLHEKLVAKQDQVVAKQEQLVPKGTSAGTQTQESIKKQPGLAAGAQGNVGRKPDTGINKKAAGLA
jgi:hypothetical protein